MGIISAGNKEFDLDFGALPISLSSYHFPFFKRETLKFNFLKRIFTFLVENDVFMSSLAYVSSSNLKRQGH